MTTKPAAGEAEALAKYEPLIKSTARRYQGRGIDREDLEQIGALAFVVAYRTATAAGELITAHTWRVEEAMRREIGQRRDGGALKLDDEAKSTRSLDAATAEDGSSLHDVYGVAATQEEVADLAMRARAVDRALVTLTPMEIAVLGERTSDAAPTLDTVAKTLGLSGARHAIEIEKRAISKLTAACAGTVAA